MLSWKFFRPLTLVRAPMFLVFFRNKKWKWHLIMSFDFNNFLRSSVKAKGVGHGFDLCISNDLLMICRSQGQGQIANTCLYAVDLMSHLHDSYFILYKLFCIYNIMITDFSGHMVKGQCQTADLHLTLWFFFLYICMIINILGRVVATRE